MLPARSLLPTLLVLLLPLVSLWDDDEPTPSDGPQFQEWLQKQGLEVSSQNLQLDEISLI